MKVSFPTKYNRLIPLSILTLFSFAILLLPGCGGGGGGGSAPAPATTGVSAGQISGFASIIVNGVRFHTGGAELVLADGSGSVTLDDNPINTQAFLSSGMEVEVEGTFDNNGEGTATRVIEDSTLEGLINGLFQAGDVFTFTLLGQNVIAANGLTVVDDTILNNDLANLTNGMIIEVHGQPDASGNVQATFIERKATLPALLELTGFVSNLNTTAFTFDIGAQPVSYSGVTPRDGILENGALVEVKGNLSGPTFVASDVEVKGGFDDDDQNELEGLITELDPDPGTLTFKIRGQLVNYGLALFRGGEEADLRNDLRVEAEGPIISGVLQADKVKFKDNFRYEGNATLDLATNQLTIFNPGGNNLTVTIDTANNLTRDDSTGGGGLKLLKVRGRQTTGTSLVATRVQDGGSADRQIFQAPVVLINDPVVELLDLDGTFGVIRVDTSTIAIGDFEIEDTMVTPDVFFNTLQVGDIVKARFRGGQWDKIEIELKD